MVNGLLELSPGNELFRFERLAVGLSISGGHWRVRYIKYVQILLCLRMRFRHYNLFKRLKLYHFPSATTLPLIHSIPCIPPTRGPTPTHVSINFIINSHNYMEIPILTKLPSPFSTRSRMTVSPHPELRSKIGSDIVKPRRAFVSQSPSDNSRSVPFIRALNREKLRDLLKHNYSNHKGFSHLSFHSDHDKWDNLNTTL